MPYEPAAAIYDAEIDFLARTIIAQHGEGAALAAEHHLDQLTKADSLRCETWVAVIDAIHMIRCRQRTGRPPGARLQA